MKKFSLLLISGILAFGLSACSQGTPSLKLIAPGVDGISGYTQLDSSSTTVIDEIIVGDPGVAVFDEIDGTPIGRVNPGTYEVIEFNGDWAFIVLPLETEKVPAGWIPINIVGVDDHTMQSDYSPQSDT